MCREGKDGYKGGDGDGRRRGEVSGRDGWKVIGR
jgi:hypothetical protein